MLEDLRRRSPVRVGTSPQSFADGLKYLGTKRLAVATSFLPTHNKLVKAFFISEGFDVLGIEGLNTGLKSIEKARLRRCRCTSTLKTWAGDIQIAMPC